MKHRSNTDFNTECNAVSCLSICVSSVFHLWLHFVFVLWIQAYFELSASLMSAWIARSISGSPGLPSQR